MAADSGIFRINPLQGWQREAILKAAAVMREKFGNPPSDAAVRAAHDGLLEVLDPARRTVRLQKEMSEATRKAALTERAERRATRAPRAKTAEKPTRDRRRDGPSAAKASVGPAIAAAAANNPTRARRAWRPARPLRLVTFPRAFIYTD